MPGCYRESIPGMGEQESTHRQTRKKDWFPRWLFHCYDACFPNQGLKGKDRAGAGPSLLGVRILWQRRKCAGLTDQESAQGWWQGEQSGTHPQATETQQLASREPLHAEGLSRNLRALLSNSGLSSISKSHSDYSKPICITCSISLVRSVCSHLSLVMRFWWKTHVLASTPNQTLHCTDPNNLPQRSNGRSQASSCSQKPSQCRVLPTQTANLPQCLYCHQQKASWPVRVAVFVWGDGRQKMWQKRSLSTGTFSIPSKKSPHLVRKIWHIG